MQVEGPSIQTRSTRDGPFCWQNKAARRLIRECFDATNNVATALAVYDALTEIASDSGAETFTTTHAWIQRMSGVSVATIKRHLAVFKEQGLVNIATPKLRAPSEYVLLSIANHKLSLAIGELALANATRGGERATSEEKQKNKIEEQGEEAAPARTLPWRSKAELPRSLQHQLARCFHSETEQDEVLSAIIGRKLRFGDEQPDEAAWAAVIASEIDDAASKRRGNSRGFANAQDYSGVVEKL